MTVQLDRSTHRSSTLGYLTGRKRYAGWTLLELMVVVAVSGVLASVAYGSYSEVIERAKITQAIIDIATIHGRLEKYRLDHNDTPPASLAEIELDLKDPWGEPYQYLNFDTLPANSIGPVRKDHNLVPINTRYDLYSKGPDGVTRPTLTSPQSFDDVLLANDGSFIGLAADY